MQQNCLRCFRLEVVTVFPRLEGGRGKKREKCPSLKPPSPTSSEERYKGRWWCEVLENKQVRNFVVVLAGRELPIVSVGPCHGVGGEKFYEEFIPTDAKNGLS